MTPGKSSRERKAEQRDRMKEKGLCEYTVIIPDSIEARAEIRKKAERLTNAHERAKKRNNHQGKDATQSIDKR